MNEFAGYTRPVPGGKQLISLDRAKALFTYDPKSGSLKWRTRPLSDFKDARVWRIWNTKYAGKEAGYLNLDGYRQLEIDHHPYLAHRIIWFLIMGVWPENVDHINGDRSFNAFANLRDVTLTENNRNLATPKTNNSGAVGVAWHSQRGKWRARIWRDGKDVSLGLFDSFEDAVAARLSESRRLGFHQNHGRSA